MEDSLVNSNLSTLHKLQSQKLGLVELLFIGFDIYRKNWKPILFIFCTLYLPFLIFSSVARTFIYKGNPDFYIVIFLGISIILRFASLPSFLAIALITEEYVQGRKFHYSSAVKHVLLRIPHLLILSSIFIINCLLRYLAFFIPGVIYEVNNQYYGLAFILRNKRGKSAFDYSRSLVKNNWRTVFTYYFLVNVSATSTVKSFISRCFSLIFALIGLISLSFIYYRSSFWYYSLVTGISQLVIITFEISSILLFINLELHRNSELG